VKIRQEDYETILLLLFGHCEVLPVTRNMCVAASLCHYCVKCVAELPVLLRKFNK
jgi:hypothetical protein